MAKKLKNFKTSEACAACGIQIDNGQEFHHLKHRSNSGGNPSFHPSSGSRQKKRPSMWS